MRKFASSFLLISFLASLGFGASDTGFNLPFAVKEGAFTSEKNIKRLDFTHAIFTQKFYRMPIDFSQPEVQRYISIYKRPHSRIMVNRALARARPFSLFIHQQLAKKGLPEELFYLPIIESEFLNTATSHAGAMGIWQIMTNSISHGMVITNHRDDRLNFWKSTDSALARLEDNYRRLKDWQLSLSAYNAGYGRITGLIRDSGVTNYWRLAREAILPKDTREYIPKFYAIVYLGSHSVQNNLRIHWDQSMDWSRIEVKKSLPLSEISENSGVPLEILKLGNAELRQARTPQDSSPFFLKVPSLWREQVEVAISGKKPESFLASLLHRTESYASFFNLPNWDNLIASLGIYEEHLEGIAISRI